MEPRVPAARGKPRHCPGASLATAIRMLFNTPTFLWFFVIVYVICRLLPMGRPRTIFLVLASYVFYMAWNPPFVLLLMFTTVLDYNVARAMGRADNPRHRKALLMVSLCANLGVLSFFKYGTFFYANFRVVMSWLGVPVHPLPFAIFLPLGISFYTFQAMSYTIDCYRRARQPTNDLISYLLYVTFFPELVSGPIVRSGQFLPQVERHQRFQWPAFCMGCNLILMGLVKKMVLADNLAVFVNQIYRNPAAASTAQAWVATWAFTAEVFCDFSGYTDIARGIAYLFGYRLPINFAQPYLATGFRDFWRRWHITLMSWLRDYLYISLGGSRKGERRTYLNLFATFVVSGMWHGASWTFIIFGAVHGVYVMTERVIFGRTGVPELQSGRRLVAVLVTVTLFTLSLVFFRSPSLDHAITMFHRMFVLTPGGGIPLRGNLQLWVPLAITFLGHVMIYLRPLDPTLRTYPRWVVPVLYAAGVLGIMLYGSAGNEFIYFQF